MGSSGNTDPGTLARYRSQRGIALVVVLIFLVLLTVLVLAFFSSVTSEYTASKTYANEVNTQLLADSTVNIVMGQIAKGTQGQSSSGSARLTWASQPGMIRTWDDSGTAQDCYKLYSSGSMVIPGSVVQGSGSAVLTAMQADVPTGWSSQPAIYTDLNAPVTDSSGTVNFPIIDGNGMSTVSVTGSNGSSMTVLTYWHQPVGKPRSPNVEGFYAQQSSSYNPNTALSTTNTPVPMPVAWLYMLKDGTIISPDPGGSGTIATFTSGTIQPSATNPIVGRVAFWTDDETCKLNINTAAEGSFYAMPHANTPTEMIQGAKTSGTTTFGFAVSPPANGEYNRYPGHPATTSLSVALGTWLSLTSGTTPPNAYTSTTSDQNYLTSLNNYLTMVPRSGTGGSQAGTVNVSGSTYAVVTSSTNRLFASFDELMFNPLRQPNPTATGSFTKSELEELKFFLTASSRAPELTPFNTPKVSLWPQWSGTADRQNYQGPTEQLLAFCSSFGTAASGSSPSGKNEYFWEWCDSNVQSISNPYGSAYYNVNAYSSINDWSGTNTNGNSTYGSIRNKAIATYLCNLGNQKIPGYGAAFRSSGKYDDLCFSNIVVDCLDYIRTCVDRIDYIAPWGGNHTADAFALDYYGVTVPPLLVADTLPGVTQSTPVKGFGFTFVFPKVALGANLQTSSTTTSGTTTTISYYVPTLTFEGYIPTWAFPAGQPQQETITLDWNSLFNLGITTTDAPPPNQQWTVNVFMGVGAYGPYGYPFGRNLPVHPFGITLSDWRFANSGTLTTVSVGGATATTGSLSNSLSMGGGPLKFSIPDSSGTVNYQTESVNFPSVTIPIPANPIGTPYTNISRSMDCNGITAARGDYRILGGAVNISSDAGGNGVTGNLYSPCVGTGSATYSSTNANVNSEYISLRTTTQVAGVPTTSIVGTLAPSVSGSGSPILSGSDYGYLAAPLAAQGLKGAWNINGQPGDWDTGTGVFPDGPYVCARDQGDTPLEAAYWPSGQSWGGDNRCFSPNRRIASAIQFGSIPTGVSAPTPRPWETLLFCPNPAARSSSFAPGANTLQDAEHIGFLNPPDHMLAEFFTMPVVQPYAISEPLSTAGKVNLNCQIAPFTYIERSTALRGVLKSTLMTGISGYDVQLPPSSQVSYKGDATYPYEIRYDINRDATIAGIEEHYFSQGQIFRYPSEICDVFLVPQKLPGATYNPSAMAPPTTYDNMLGWWNPMASSADPLAVMGMTGDNLREEPYNYIYPRLTTQSNTYTVHCRVQTLKKRTGSNQAEWDEGIDLVTAEYRGSSLIERYIDPNDPALNSNWDNDTISVNLSGTNHADLSTLYKFRVVSKKKFAP